MKRIKCDIDLKLQATSFAPLQIDSIVPSRSHATASWQIIEEKTKKAYMKQKKEKKVSIVSLLQQILDNKKIIHSSLEEAL